MYEGLPHYFNDILEITMASEHVNDVDQAMGALNKCGLCSHSRPPNSGFEGVTLARDRVKFNCEVDAGEGVVSAAHFLSYELM